jgi:iron complex transport system permease protein
MSSFKKRILIHFLIYGVVAFFIIFSAPFVGSEKLNFHSIIKEIFDNTNGTDSTIFLYIRIPRILLGFFAGGTLALVGAVFQVVLRNPLATPYTLGVTGGGTLGAVIAISLPGFYLKMGPFSTIQLFSLIGSFTLIVIIYKLAQSKHGVSMNTLLLAGVTIGIISGSLVLFVRYLVDPNLLAVMDRWMMGGLTINGYRELAALFPLLFPGLFMLFTQAPALNLMTFGSEIAAGHGVEVRKVQFRSLVGGCLATASVVSMVGPIGFIGLIIPHGIRRISGYDHRLVLPASFLTGGSFLVLCDIFARTITPPIEIPVGILTAMIGGPIFIKILLKKKSKEFK